MNTLKNILIFFLAAAIAAVFALFSFAFGSANPQSSLTQKGQLSAFNFYRTKLIKNDAGVTELSHTPVTVVKNGATSFSKDEMGYVEFGRLASLFLLPDEKNEIVFSKLSITGTTLVLPDAYQGIVSLYDPFTAYRIASANQDFVLEQMTNGSFYIGKEADGTLSIYSIDGVGRLDFLHEGNYMTDMVLFPGMYIRFDPKLNSTLLGADLFRIMLSMVPDGTKGDVNNTTGVEFVNPRMNDTEDKDVFFMYRLPLSSRILFRGLHVLFHDRVARVDLYRDYGSSEFGFSENEPNTWLLNPSKKNHFLLRDLDAVLAEALRPNSSLNRERFSAKIAAIYSSSQSLTLGNSVTETLERFLTDGRFALFSGNKINQNFADIYAAVSEAVGITPQNSKMQLFEKLSDIYSRNLVTQKKDFAFSKIDTYTPTSLELAKTLNLRDIEHKDYFDIALYAFYVLSKTEEKGMIVPEALYAHPTYELLSTIFRATDLYVRSLTDNERKIVTYKSISLQFYDRVLSTLVRSLYTTFLTEQDGHLFLKENFVDPTEGTVKFDSVLISDFRSLSDTIDGVFANLSIVYQNDQKNPTYVNIKNAFTAYKGFVKLFENGAYNQYLLNPYKANVSEDGVLMPQIAPDGSLVVGNRIQNEGNTDQETPPPSEEESFLASMRKLLPSLTANDILKEGDVYRISGLPYRVTSSSTQTYNDLLIFVAFDKTAENFSDFQFEVAGKRVSVTTPDQKTPTLYNTMKLLPAYADGIKSIFSQNPNLTGDIRILESSRKIIIGNYVFDF